jgi:hypothetical protein
MTKRKAVKPRKRADSFDSPDGQTQSCDACTLERTAGPHRCGRREVTEEEHEFIEAGLFLLDHLGSPYTLYQAAWDRGKAAGLALRRSRWQRKDPT